MEGKIEKRFAGEIYGSGVSSRSPEAILPYRCPSQRPVIAAGRETRLLRLLVIGVATLRSIAGRFIEPLDQTYAITCHELSSRPAFSVLAGKCRRETIDRVDSISRFPENSLLNEISLD